MIKLLLTSSAAPVRFPGTTEIIMTLSDRFHWKHYPEVCSERNFLLLRAMTIYARWRQRWYHRIGTRAKMHYHGNGPCSVCGHRNTVFSVGEWRCGRHLRSLVG